MKGFLRPLFLRLLLLCVVLNLGDAPYLDELIDELNQSMAVAAQMNASADGSKASQQHVAKAKHSIYEELLANVPMPQSEHDLLSFSKPADEAPEAVVVHHTSPPLFAIERPPRHGFTA